MIIYNMKKPIDCIGSDCVGVTGDNIAYTQGFYIKGISDDSISYTIHLRFADGSVNSVTPSRVVTDGEGTAISWIIKKNDIFAHGFFEVQIEGRNKAGLVFQTEIAKLYADESLAVEDKEYENPNSETLRLRDEAYSALEEIKGQQEQIAENLNLIEQSDLSLKADKATTLSGYGITDAYTKAETDSALSLKISNEAGSVSTENIADKAVTNEKLANGAVTSMKIANNSVSGAAIVQNQINAGHIINGAVTADKLSDDVKTLINEKAKSDDVNSKLSEKADKATTLDGYGITDGEKAGNKVFGKNEVTDEENNYPSIGYLKNFYYEYSEVDEALSKKADKATTLFGYGINDAYTKQESKNLYGLNISVVFDENFNPLNYTEAASISAGSFATGNKNIKTAFIAKNLRYIGGGAFANCDNLTDVYIDNPPESITVTSGAIPSTATIHYNADFNDNKNLIASLINLNSKLSKKYDSSNIETGSGELKTTDVNSDKINSASFEYQKIGSYVNVHIYIDFKAFSISNTNQSISLSGLPFVCCNTVNPRELCITSQKKQLAWAIARNSSSLTLLFLNTDLFAENEKLSFSLRYKIE